MFPFQSHLGYQNYWSSVVQEHRCPGTIINGENSIMSSTPLASKVEKKPTMGACRTHKEAERRRRQRINAHLSTLRTLLPNTVKTDKASLLAEVVNYVKELRKQADEVAERDWSLCWSGNSRRSEEDSWPFPGESDELTLIPHRDNGTGKQRLIKAILCCEDRPGLNRELTRAISLVRARVVRAEMMTVGGRTKRDMVMEWVGGGGNQDMGVLQRALKDVVNNRVKDCGPDRIRVSSKRARVSGSFNERYNDAEAFRQVFDYGP